MGEAEGDHSFLIPRPTLCVAPRTKAAEKPAKVAILAIARKLLTIFNAMLRDQRNYA